MARIGTAILLVVALLGGAPTLPATAAFPGANGKVAFSTSRDPNEEIYVMNPDGTGPMNVTNDASLDRAPAWSSDGSRIAFARGDEIYVMNADGSGQIPLTNNLAFDGSPSWSPDGTKIAFSTSRDGDDEIYVMDASGSGQTNLTNDGLAADRSPAWSPDGTKIAFAKNSEIYVMNADGSDQTNLTNHLASDRVPSWSPDGTKIAFESDRDGNQEIYVMNANGSGQTRLTTDPEVDTNPEWSPNGTRIVFRSDRDGNREIYVMHADGSGQTNITNNASADDNPDWQPLAPMAKLVTLKAKPKKVEQGEKVRLKATVAPCEGHEGDLVDFYRKQKLIATKANNAECVAKLKVKVKKTTKFHAVSPMQDLDHLAGTSKPVKVKVIDG